MLQVGLVEGIHLDTAQRKHDPNHNLTCRPIQTEDEHPCQHQPPQTLEDLPPPHLGLIGIEQELEPIKRLILLPHLCLGLLPSCLEGEVLILLEDLSCPLLDLDGQLVPLLPPLLILNDLAGRVQTLPIPKQDPEVGEGNSQRIDQDHDSSPDLSEVILLRVTIHRIVHPHEGLPVVQSVTGEGLEDLGGDRGEDDEAEDEDDMGEVGPDLMFLLWLTHLIHLVDSQNEEKDEDGSQGHDHHLSDEVALDHTVHGEELDEVQVDEGEGGQELGEGLGETHIQDPLIGGDDLEESEEDLDLGLDPSHPFLLVLFRFLSP